MSSETQPVRNRRTQAQMLEDLETRVIQLKERERMKSLQDHPDIAPMIEKKADLARQINILKRGMGDGPQSFDERIAKHEAWIVRIKAEYASAEGDIKALEIELETLKTEITEAMVTIKEVE